MQTDARGHPRSRLPAHRNNASARGFELVARLHDDRLELVLAGDLDMPATFRLEPEFDRLLAAHELRRVVLDLAAVGFIDSAGLGLLLSMRERTRDLGVAMELANVSDPVLRILELSGTRALLTD
jgi:anti-sigma B factor antagonist